VNALVASINDTTARFGIDTTARRVRYFVAQSFFETQSYTKWSENLVYTTPQRLVTVWPHRFTMDKSQTNLAYAPDYVNNAQKLANLTYANRYGNGNEASGDGWKYRGRGGFHLTFKNNYQKFSMDTYKDGRIVSNPDLVSQPQDAMLSAGWFWTSNGLSALADTDSFTRATEVINGSAETVPARLPVLTKVNSLFTW
jgi:putative chitinase